MLLKLINNESACTIILSIFSCKGDNFSLTKSVKPGATDVFNVSPFLAFTALSFAGIIPSNFPPINPDSYI